MSKNKYVCSCGNKVDKLTSYFKNSVRVTLCDRCAEENGLTQDADIIKVDYDKIKTSSKEENFYHMIDTRENK